MQAIDAGVEVDLQYMIACLVTAANGLRVGGRLVLTLANLCSEGGFNKLIRDTKTIFNRMNTHRAKFEWMSPDQVGALLPRLGFEIDLHDTSGRDMLVVATFVEAPTDAFLPSCIA